jgi:hypothetical protein
MAGEDFEGIFDYVDEDGRAFSPFIERGSDNVPKRVGMPDLDDLRSIGTLSDEDITAMNYTLERYGFVNTPDKVLIEQTKYMELWGLDGDASRYAETMKGKVLLGQTRRISEKYETLVLIDGDTSTQMIYGNEGDDPCDGCLPLGGETGTYAEFVAEDMLPGSRCFGGNLCQCVLMAFE